MLPLPQRILLQLRALLREACEANAQASQLATR